MEAPLTPWDIEALAVERCHARSTRNARDIVIMDWLVKGDTRPFADWVMCGHAPSHKVLLALAVMMARADNPHFDPAGVADPAIREVADCFPLGIEVTGKGKRTSDPANVVRDKIIAREMVKVIARGLSRERAAGFVMDWLADIGIHMGSDNVEKAYKAHKSKFTGMKSSQSVP